MAVDFFLFLHACLVERERGTETDGGRVLFVLISSVFVVWCGGERLCIESDWDFSNSPKR